MHAKIRHLLLPIMLAMALSCAHAQQTSMRFDLPAQPLADSLRALGKLTDTNILIDRQLIGNRQAPAVRAQMTVAEALTRLLEGTGLIPRFVDEKTVVLATAGAQNIADEPIPLSQVESPARIAQAAVGRSAAQTAAAAEQTVDPDSYKGMSEILVKGSKILNMDIRRTRDDPQPYVVFNSETLRQSGAVNLNEFLKQRLPMNTVGQSANQNISQAGNRSEINLRGLGANQTLILVDGRRLASTAINAAGGPLQPDINGIPLSAVERIEILPSTASGIYGGSATGGVLNIILKRDYVGTEITAGYDNTFDSDSGRRTLGLNTGFTLEGGKTSVLMAANYSDGNLLTARDRNFTQEYKIRQYNNNPAAYQPPTLSPLGNTPNIRSSTGAVLTLKPAYGGASLGQAFTSVPYGYQGVAASGVAGLIANAGRYNLDLANTAQGGGAKAALANTPTTNSFAVTLRREFTSRVQVFLDASTSRNEGLFNVGFLGSAAVFALPASAPTNPFQQAISVWAPLSISDNARYRTLNRENRLTAGTIFQLPRAWQGEVDFSLVKSRYRQNSTATLSPGAAAAVSSGAIDVLRDTLASPPDFSAYYLPETTFFDFPSGMKNATLRVSGPVRSLPAGALMVSAAVEWRDESFDTAYARNFNVSAPNNINFNISPDRSQQVASVYLEARVPLSRGLELQVAGRRDDYQVKGSTGFINVSGTGSQQVDRFTNTLSSLDPTVALHWKPVEDAAFRASYGTGFLPPTVAQLVPSLAVSITQAQDPRRGGSTTTLTLPSQNPIGGNPNLKPEESESFSAGVVLTPRWTPGLRLSVDYTKIDTSQGIQNIPNLNQGLLDNESLFPERVVRGPNLPGDPLGWAGPVILLDRTLMNISRSSLEAYDVQLDYTRTTERFGAFSFYTLATWTTHRKTQLMQGQPVLENVGYVDSGLTGNPLKFKAGGGITWRRGPLTLGWNSQYFDSYLAYSSSTTGATLTSAILSQGNNGVVEDQIYHDVFGVYRFGEAGDGAGLARLLGGAEITMGLRNLFNSEPPYQHNGVYFASPFGDGRMASYYLTLKHTF